MKEELFRKSSLEHLTSLEKLDKCVKVTNPGAWLIVTGMFLLLLSAGIWSGAAALKTSVPVTGVVHETMLHVFVSPEQAEELKEGMTVEEEGEIIGKIAEIIKEPVSRKEAGKAYLTAYYRDTKLKDWNVEILVEVHGKVTEGEEKSCRIITDEKTIRELILE